MCGPLCPIGIAGGLWISRFFGINDFTLGLWCGALIFSLLFQSYILLKKNKKIFLIFWLIFVFLTIFSFFNLWLKLKKNNLFLSLPLFISGFISGIFILITMDYLHNLIIKKYHNNKVYFPYERVIVPILFLILFSFLSELIFH